MNVYIASDHAGFDLKAALIPYIGSLGHFVVDCGPDVLNPEDDYPKFIAPCAQKVAEDPGSMGIIMGGSGEGEAMVANRQKGVRAGVYYAGDLTIVKLIREHNDANVLSLGARFILQDEAFQAVKLFLETPFSGDERHMRRIAQF
jgi:ribose 5-phosphate isomerase B